MNIIAILEKQDYYLIKYNEYSIYLLYTYTFNHNDVHGGGVSGFIFSEKVQTLMRFPIFIKY